MTNIEILALLLGFVIGWLTLTVLIQLGMKFDRR